MNLDILNDNQREAVIAPDKPILVLAGAGSGKTRVLTYRIGHLISNGAEPSRILAVTFTNKAAGEMKQRLHELVGSSANKIWSGTFHGICLRFLRKYATYLGYKPNFTIYDDTDSKKIIKDIIKDRESEINFKVVYATISSLKSKLVSVQVASQTAQRQHEKEIAQIYSIYMDKLMENNAMDFDDLINNVVHLLRNHPEMESKIVDRFDYVLIDEYQDTNPAQYAFLNLMCRKSRNVFTVGDDFQSIYKFRGADISNILNFERDYPEAIIIKLEQNYRSTKKIVAAGNEIIKYNESQKKKDLWTENNTGSDIMVRRCFNENVEGEWIANKIHNLKKYDVDLSKIAILYRANYQSRAVERALLEAGIPYEIIGGIAFFERKEIKDLMAYLKIVANNNDSISLERIINVPKRGLGNATLNKIRDYASENNISFFDALATVKKIEKIGKKSFLIKDFHEIISSVGDNNSKVSSTLKEIIARTEYLEYLESAFPEEFEDRYDNVKELLNIAWKYDIENEEDRSVPNFLQEISLQSDIDGMKDTDKTVKLMTVHSSKGLEFNTVFLCGFEEGIFPHQRSIDEGDLEEERRLCYVAITRAEENLYISHAETRQMFGQDIEEGYPSRFLKEIPEELIQMA